MAEWSKAVALGAIPKGRGFEPHWCQLQILNDHFLCLLAKNDATLAMPLVVSAEGRVLLHGATVGALDIAHLPYSAVSRMMKGYACGSKPTCDLSDFYPGSKVASELVSTPPTHQNSTADSMTFRTVDNGEKKPFYNVRAVNDNMAEWSKAVA